MQLYIKVGDRCVLRGVPCELVDLDLPVGRLGRERSLGGPTGGLGVEETKEVIVVGGEPGHRGYHGTSSIAAG